MRAILAAVAAITREGNSVRKLAISAIAVLLALLSVGVARADSNDDDFVLRLTPDGGHGVNLTPCWAA
jgi:hypothetical protein